MPKEVTKHSHSYSYYKTNADDELFYADISILQEMCMQGHQI